MAKAIETGVTCAHHWVIPMPAGPYSKGRCILCGEVREFRNSEDEWGPAERSKKAHAKYCSKEAV